MSTKSYNVLANNKNEWFLSDTALHYNMYLAAEKSNKEEKR